MDVLNGVPDCFRLIKAAVVACSSLPESVHRFTLRIHISHFAKTIESMLSAPMDGFLGNWEFDAGQDRSNHRTSRIGKQEQMHMSWHEYPCPKIEAMDFLGPSQRLQEPASCSIGSEKRLILETREG
jgi:hypothetical protein